MFHKFWIDIKTVIEIFHILQKPLQRSYRLYINCVLTTAICNQEQTKIRIKTVIMNTTI